MGLAEGAQAGAAIVNARSRREQVELRKQQVMREVAEQHRNRAEARRLGAQFETELRHASGPMTRLLVDAQAKLANPKTSDEEAMRIHEQLRVGMLYSEQAKTRIMTKFMGMASGNPDAEKLVATAFGNQIQAWQNGAKMAADHSKLLQDREQFAAEAPVRESVAAKNRALAEEYNESDPNMRDLGALMSDATTSAEGRFMTMTKKERAQYMDAFGLDSEESVLPHLIDSRIDTARRGMQRLRSGPDAGAGLTEEPVDPLRQRKSALKRGDRRMAAIDNMIESEKEAISTATAAMQGLEDQLHNPKMKSSYDDARADAEDARRRLKLLTKKRKERASQLARERGSLEEDEFDAAVRSFDDEMEADFPGYAPDEAAD